MFRGSSMEDQYLALAHPKFNREQHACIKKKIPPFSEIFLYCLTLKSVMRDHFKS